MHRRSVAVALTLALSVTVGFASAAIAQKNGSTASQADRATIARLSWISGCWIEHARGGSIVEEQWTSPSAGTMVGLGRTVRGDSTLVEYEHLNIFTRAGRIVYHAEPSGQTPTDFETATMSDTLIAFENPTHDYPQKVIYRKRGADSLLARIEGTAGGKFRGIDFPYVRVPCAGPAAGATTPRR